MFCFSRPAARRIGRVYSRSSCSASVSRMIGGPFSGPPSPGDLGANASATPAGAAGPTSHFWATAPRRRHACCCAPRLRRAHASTPRRGRPRLLPAIPRNYRAPYGGRVDAERIVVATGSSGACILGFLAMFDPGDGVAVTVPGYPPYRHILTALGCEPVLIETSSETRHALTGEALLAAHRKTPLKGVLVGSPANPTGTMMSREALARLIAAAVGAGRR